jgi:hypothetical protein
MNDKIDKIKIFFPFYAVIFLCTGIFYNYLYLGHFGIETSKFFTLNDYIATSIDKIILNLFPIVASYLVLLMPYKKLPKNVTAPFKIEELIVLMLFCVPGVIMLMYNNPKGFYIIGITFSSVIGYIISRILLKGPTKYRELFYVIFLLFFISGVWAAAMSARFHIENDDINKAKKYSFFFEKKTDGNFLIKDESTVLLAANSNYYFFYDKNNKKTYIIPMKKVIAIETPSPELQSKDDQQNKAIEIIQNKNVQQKKRGDRE